MTPIEGANTAIGQRIMNGDGTDQFVIDNPPYDPRGIANLLLDQAEQQRGSWLTNLVLQKLLYFAHARFLIETGSPLLSGYFEAWKFGPVHPAVYQAFKAAGDHPIDFRAVGTDLLTGTKFTVEPPDSREVRDLLVQMVHSYGAMSPGRLVDIAHAPNAPWDFVANKGETLMEFGLRISDNVIRERFKFHKIAVASSPRHGEPSEEPPCHYDFS